MPPKKTVYSITRDEAAAALNVSTRTLDRYIRSGKLNSKNDGRTVLIEKSSLANLTKQLKARAKKSTAKPKKRVFAEQTKAEAVFVEEKVFRDLYEEATRDLKTKQEKLEAASFRVGQLEAQIKNSVPLLEYRQREDELQKEASSIREAFQKISLQRWIFLGGFVVATLAAIGLAIAFIV